MPLPQIINPKPVVVEAVPAIPEYRYDEAYVVGMLLSTTTPINQQLEITLRPYNQADGKVYPDSSADSVFVVPDIWAEAARSSLFAQVMGGICQVTSLLVREKFLESLESRTPEQEAELVATRTALGVN